MLGKRSAAAFAVSILMFTTLSLPALAKGYDVLGVGNLSCGHFIDAVDHESKSDKAVNDEYEMLSWAQGYLTHLNLANTLTNNIAGRAGPEGMSQWLKNHCRANPLKSFNDAVEELVVALWAERNAAQPHK
jgi:hypothetical protein